MGVMVATSMQMQVIMRTRAVEETDRAGGSSSVAAAPAELEAEAEVGRVAITISCCAVFCGGRGSE